MKFEVRKKPYTITNGNGGIQQAQVLAASEKPPAVQFRVRKANRGRYSAIDYCVQPDIFRALIADSE